MSQEPSPVQLPDELLAMLHLAQDSFLYYETESKIWDEQSLVRFRDVLYDLVKAAEATTPAAQQRYIGAAMEHLALTIAEPLQRRVETLLAEIDRPMRFLKIFRWTHRYSQDVTAANVAAVKQRIEYQLAEGRKAKTGLTLADAQRAYNSFREAYKSAMFLKNALAARNPRTSVTVILWVISIILAGLISAVIARMF